MISWMIAILSGIVVGSVSGITPGVHINLIAAIVGGISGTLLYYGFSPLTIGIFIISVGITHTFLDVIPSIFLGAPNEDTALGVLPGHRYLLRGNGLSAVKLFTIGSFLGLIVGVLLFPILFWITEQTYAHIAPYFAALLIAVSGIMILRDQKKWWALAVYCTAGILGLVLFRTNITEPLLPLFSGLFGVSTLLVSLRDTNNIPLQKITETTTINRLQTGIALMLGNFSAWIVSTFPGLSSSIAATLSTQLYRNLGDKGFMIVLGCIGTSSFLMSLVAWYVVDKARNGAVIVMQRLMSLDSYALLVLTSSALIVGGIATILTIKCGRFFSKIISRVPYAYVVWTIITFVFILVGGISGPTGIMVLVTSSALGVIPAIVKVQRTHSMACLIVPTILYLV